MHLQFRNLKDGCPPGTGSNSTASCTGTDVWGLPIINRHKKSLRTEFAPATPRTARGSRVWRHSWQAACHMAERLLCHPVAVPESLER